MHEQLTQHFHSFISDTTNNITHSPGAAQPQIYQYFHIYMPKLIAFLCWQWISGVLENFQIEFFMFLPLAAPGDRPRRRLWEASPGWIFLSVLHTRLQVLCSHVELDGRQRSGKYFVVGRSAARYQERRNARRGAYVSRSGGRGGGNLVRTARAASRHAERSARAAGKAASSMQRKFQHAN